MSSSNARITTSKIIEITVTMGTSRTVSAISEMKTRNKTTRKFP